MNQRWRRFFADWATTGRHRHLVAETSHTIAWTLAHSRKPLVSFSGGKDSTVLTHLVLRQDPEVTVLHWDYGERLLPRHIEQGYLDALQLLRARHVRVFRREDFTVGFYQAFFGSVVPQLAAEGFDTEFVGLRNEESGRRRRRIAKRESLTDIVECWPLAAWRWEDVWAYIVEHDLPYPAIYDEMAEIEGWGSLRLSVIG